MPRSGPSRIVLIVAFVLACGSWGLRPILAAEPSFPYEAVVVADDAYARCGPGVQGYYATLQLKRGDRVTVRRHDPNSWIMIDPPAGSFSLIRADAVDRQGNVGVVKALDQGQVSVRVGSAAEPGHHSVFQRRLSSGESVEILGEGVIAIRDHDLSVLKIRPPKGEYRWIEGQKLAAVNTSSADSPLAASPPVAPQAVASAPESPGCVSRSPLEANDWKFRAMLQQSVAQWNFAEIEANYRNLAAVSNSPAWTAQLERRLSAVGRYQQIKAEYDEYDRLVSRTTKKDAELAAIEGSYAPQNTRPPIGGAAPTQQATIAVPARGQADAVSANLAPAVPNPQVASSGTSNWNRSSNGSNGNAPSAAPVWNNPQPQMLPPNGGSYIGPVLQSPIAQSPIAQSTVPDAPANLPTPATSAPPRSAPVMSAPAPAMIVMTPAMSIPTPPASVPQTMSPAMIAPAAPDLSQANAGYPPIVPPAPSQFVVDRRSAPNPTPLPPMAAPRQIRPSNPNGLDGAGILQWAAATVPGGPRHVLLTPNGRILAYLWPDRGVNLDSYIGRPMGIKGPRSFHPELQADLIIVQGMTPVRLVQ